MKLKLILVPGIIALIVVLGIWFIYPAYSNGTDGVMDHYKQLKAEKQKLDSIKGKSGNANSLSSQLDSLGSDKEALYEFVPTNIKESEIVNNLNKMAADSGLLIFGLTVGRPSLSVASMEAPQKPGINPSIPVLPKAKTFSADMQISGSYDQVKTFLNKVDNFARYEAIASLNLKKGSSVSGQAGAGAPDPSMDILAADLKITFNMLDKAKLSGDNVNDAVFSSSSLNTDIISQIKSSRSELAVGVDTGQKGKANPFLP